MTHSRNLAATIARAIFDRIERDRTLILQNIEEVIHDALLLDGAKQEGDKLIDKIAKGLAFDRNFEAEMRDTVWAITGINPRGEIVTSAVDPMKPKPDPEPHWGSLKNWWQTEPGPEAGE